jgi:hypothetical protein
MFNLELKRTTKIKKALLRPLLRIKLRRARQGLQGHATLSYQTFLNFLYQSFEKYGLPRKL